MPPSAGDFARLERRIAHLERQVSTRPSRVTGGGFSRGIVYPSRGGTANGQVFNITTGSSLIAIGDDSNCWGVGLADNQGTLMHGPLCGKAFAAFKAYYGLASIGIGAPIWGIGAATGTGIGWDTGSVGISLTRSSGVITDAPRGGCSFNRLLGFGIPNGIYWLGFPQPENVWSIYLKAIPAGSGRNRVWGNSNLVSAAAYKTGTISFDATGSTSSP